MDFIDKKRKRSFNSGTSRHLTISALFLIICSASTLAGPWPWQRRVGRNVEVRHKLAHQAVDPQMWPDEPLSPNPINSGRFSNALGMLCGRMPDERLAQYTENLLRGGREFGVDPFLMAAIMYDQSACLPKTPDREVRHGITRIDVNMHAPHIRSGEYRYFLKEGDSWKRHTLKIDRYPFNKWKAEKIESAIYFTAAILKVFEMQCEDLDEAFGGAPHRHPVSHWFFGDRVKESEPEDRVLTVRRRLLAYYNESIPEAAGTFNGIPIVSPLDGTPRVVIDYFGNRRGKKIPPPGHRGIDIVGANGEPVRSVADGRVSFSGVDMPGQARSRALSPKEAQAMPNRQMGPGGLYIAVNHGGGLGSVYMHLDSLAVEQGQEVKAGDIIGTLGRSGTVQSGPHLHLEFRVGTDRIDPAVPLADVLINPFLSD